MTLQQLKDGVETLALALESINSFEFGEDFLLATGKGSDYPMVFLEIPYAINYDVLTGRFKTVQFALMVLFSSTDQIITDHELISKAESIGDYLLKQIKEAYVNEFTLTSANAVSVRNYSDDVVSGVIIDVAGTTRRTCALEC